MDREFYTGFIRLHILYHAKKEPFFGLWIIKELHRHGYDLSPGTLYPILHRMEKRGYLQSHKELVNGKIRRVYAITSDGETLLDSAMGKVKELFSELFEE